ncbi:hypothetical protein GCM10010502_73260 [Kitasatospora aureofaciens]|uniref:Uncharacterized protein n=1 Tax=Kitasatospora aureofaciens TaxID=1894 RepID=A0A8H9I5U1_KITAU|nr:hypothetical protein GCM10010502_73260 [Kitasatospora aureofaciens]
MFQAFHPIGGTCSSGAAVSAAAGTAPSPATSTPATAAAARRIRVLRFTLGAMRFPSL